MIFRPLSILVVFVGCLVACGSQNTGSGTTEESAPDTQNPAPDTIEAAGSTPSAIRVCSFNIKFVGLYTKKENEALADLLKPYDLVLIQELVSPPAAGTFPDGTPYEADAEARAFVDAMTAKGYSYVLSSEDTGTGDNIHSNASSTEWFIAFYKPEAVTVATDLFTGFVADDRSNHPSYERVPHAFSFRTVDNGLDFTLISVHLKPGSGPSERARRAEELQAIASWIGDHTHVEKDFIIAGDMNIYKQDELLAASPPGYKSLNEACVATTVTGAGNPYDHVMYSETFTTADLMGDFEVVNLVEAMRPYWTYAEPYPEPGSLFYQYYSDHHPVVFTLVSDGQDDD